jgi:hypothetical protein
MVCAKYPMDGQIDCIHLPPFVGGQRKLQPAAAIV